MERGTNHMEPEKVRAPNIRDVARLAGVSYQTVSRVLNEHPSIRETTKQRVLDVITEIGYRPNQAARALVTSRSRTIGVLTAQTADYGPSTSVTAIEHAAREAGYRITVTSIASSEYTSIRVALDQLLTQAVDVNGLKVLAAALPGADAKTLRDTMDKLKDKLKTAAIVLAAVDGDKVQLAAGVTADSVGKVKAGELVNFVAQQVGGKGGGKPDMAMAGGTDASKVPAALASVQAWVAERV